MSEIGCSIKIDNLSKVYSRGNEKVVALSNIQLHVKPGEFLTVMGASGSGKSTLLNILGGLDSFNDGNIYINDQSITGWSDKDLTLYRREKVGFIFQSFNLIPTLTVEDNVALPLLIQKKPKIEWKPEVDRLLQKMGLLERKYHYPPELSGGQMQRVAITRAIIGKPMLILADEPTGNLDSTTGEKVLYLLKSLNEDYGVTMILVTHDPKIASYGDRAITIKDGEITAIARGLL